MKSEAMDSLMQSLHDKVKGSVEKKEMNQTLNRSQPYISEQSNSVIFIKGIPEDEMKNWGLMKPIQISDDGLTAMVIGIEEK